MAITRDESGERTEQPTRLRLAEARRNGQVARSADLCSVTVAAAALAGLVAFGPPMLTGLRRMTAGMLSAPDGSVGLTATSSVFGSLLGGVLWPVVGFCAVVSVAAVGANILQFGMLWAPGQFRAELGRISPIAGAGRMFSRRTAVRGTLTLAKLVAIATVTAITIARELPRIVAAAGIRTVDLAGEVGTLILMLTIRIGAVLVVLAVIDLLYQRWQLREDLKMTRRELLEDLKRSEGDPLIRARRRSIRAQRHSAEVAESKHRSDEN